MKKGILMLAVIGMLLVSCSGAWAYSTTFTSILTDSPGTARVTVDIWDPADYAGGLNPYYGFGYWGYIYTLENINYDSYLTNFNVGVDASTPLIWVGSPTGWTYSTFPGQFQWSATTGYQLNTGNSISGFEVKSTYWPDRTWTQTWRGGFNPANGFTLGPGIPEPGSMMLLGFGLMGLIGGVVRKKVKA